LQTKSKIHRTKTAGRKDQAVVIGVRKVGKRGRELIIDILTKLIETDIASNLI
jgi:hypothetical protein